jgi:hypothetical protein
MLGIVCGRAHESEELAARANRRRRRIAAVARRKVDIDCLEQATFGAEPNHVSVAKPGERPVV